MNDQGLRDEIRRLLSEGQITDRIPDGNIDLMDRRSLRYFLHSLQESLGDHSVMWATRTFGSGTMIVTSGEPGQPHLYVYGPDVNDGRGYDPGTQHNRYQCCLDLEDFLNGGPRPLWLDDLTRVNEEHAEDVDKTSITAVGPMVDRNPPALDWVTDDSNDAKDARARLMDRLFLKSLQIS